MNEIHEYTDNAGQTWIKGPGWWHFDDGAGGEWLVLDGDMAEIIKAESIANGNATA